MLDDISMPNQSMTMSNLSHMSTSPFRGGGTTPGRGNFMQYSNPHSQSGTQLNTPTAQQNVPISQGLMTQSAKKLGIENLANEGTHSSIAQKIQEKTKKQIY